MEDQHYIVSARKYRPSTFATVIGQRPLTAALKHAIATDRLAHAYLFTGSRGVGKTSCARIFAKTINCQHRTPDGEACNECESCQQFNRGNSLNIVELDAASHNGVEDIKALCEQVQVPPTTGKYRVFIIDEVHMLSSAAFNAFLKTLEEPPEYVIFILATTEKHKIIPTILSRCQIYDFSRITIQDMIDHLSYVAEQEGISADKGALNLIARKADGAMRDALSIFDQVAASSMGNITYQSAIDNLNVLDSAYYSRLIEAFLTGNVPSALLIYKEIRDKGFDSQFFINGLGLYMRDLMVAMNPATLPLLEMADEIKAQMAQVAQKCSPQFLYRAMDLCNEADLNYRAATSKQFLVELTLVKLCQLCSPSPGIDGGGEGQLKPIAATPQPAMAPAPANPAAPITPVNPANPAFPAKGQGAQGLTGGQGASGGQNPTATAPRRPASGPHISLSIKGIKPQTQAPEPKLGANSPKRAESYTEQQLMDAWFKYTQDHPTEKILVNTMLSVKLQKIADDQYLVPVDDNIQVETFNEAMPNLRQFMRDALKNDNIDLQVRVIQGESSPITWTQAEVLQHMMEQRPALRDFLQAFNFSLQ
ncbi:MAG: DNA polymerase III subunit gamma/tau [Bacteroidales bacterium]|nr:DNA polymerase III subunit gamma/tau [Bacteroidales bacterium]